MSRRGFFLKRGFLKTEEGFLKPSSRSQLFCRCQHVELGLRVGGPNVCQQVSGL